MIYHELYRIAPGGFMGISSTVLWAILGIILVVAEIFTSTFVLLFLGISAIIVAAIKFFGLSHLATELIIFAILSLAGILFFRKKFVEGLQVKGKFSIDGEQKLVLTAAIPAQSSAVIQYQGTTWTAVNESDEDYAQGRSVIIDRTEGVKLVLKK